MKKREKVLILFILSMIFFSLNFVPKINGNIIGTFLNVLNIPSLLGIIFLMGSFAASVFKQNLDAIIIPTGNSFKEDRKRTIKAIEKYKEEGTKYFVISGEKGKPKLSESQRYGIYKELRKHNIKPSQMIIEGKSSNNLENALYSLTKLKEMETIGIVSYPKHLERFKDIINKAKKEKLIPKTMIIKYLPTKQTLGEWIYGTLANIKEKYELRKGINKILNK
jgi:uncharacterized SAM-binding protein YcdF (DUF218 family)